MGELKEINAIPLKTDTIIEDTHVTLPGVYRCGGTTTQNMPNGSSGVYIMIARSCYNESAYMVYELFGLVTMKRYTSLKVDNNFTEWKEF